MKTKKTSFKLKITLWYAVFMVLLLSLTLSVVYFMSASTLKKQTDEKIFETTQEIERLIQYKDGIFEFDENILELDEMISVLVYDQYGNILFGSTPKRFPIDLAFSYELTSINLPENNKYLYRDKDLLLDGAPFKLIVRVISTYTSVNLTLRYFLIASLILGPVGIFIAILGGNRMMAAIFKPIENITDTAHAITLDNDLSLRIEKEDKSDELSKLVDTINTMLSRIETSFNRERDFTHDISHELRTPLTGMLLDIELLEMKETYDKDLIERLHTQTQWMHHLIESMSLSTQKLEPKDLETIHLKRFLENLKENYTEQIHLFIDDEITIQTDIILFTRIITNLFNNAFQYGASKVTVMYQRSHQIIIEDDGDGMSEETLAKIWDRFYQHETSRTTSLTSGLGLYFVKQAISALGWEIDVKSERNHYTRFKITIY